MNLFAILATASLTIGIALTTNLSAEDWPQFRGPDWTATSETDAPTEWSDDKNIAWKAALPGRGSSSPIVVGDRIFVTAFSGFGQTAEAPGMKGNLQLHTICIDRKTGDVIWDKTIPGSEHTQPATSRVVDHGFSSATPISDGDAVYASFGVSGVVAYDMDGKQLWHSTIGEKTTGFGSSASPSLFENLVIVNACIESRSVIAFDKKSGDEVWRIDDIVRTWTMPVIARTKDGSSEMILNDKNTIYGFDPRTGKELWHCDGIEDYIVPVPVFHDGVVYCPGGRSNRFIAIKLGGRGDVSESHKLWQIQIGANVTSPVYFDGHLYWASDKGIANCVRASDGESVFRERMPTRSRVYASIIRAGKHLYMTTRDSGVLVIKAQPEYAEVAKNTIDSIDGMVNGTPAAVDGQLFLRTDSQLFCIGKK